MLRLDAGPPLPRERGPNILALGISFGLHGAAFAGFILFWEVKPPEPLAVILVELVQAADDFGSPEEDAGKQPLPSHALESAIAEAAETTRNMARLADFGTQQRIAVARTPFVTPVERANPPYNIKSGAFSLVEWSASSNSIPTGIIPVEKLAAFEAATESPVSPVTQSGEPIAVSGHTPTPRNTADRHKVVPPTPAEPILAAEKPAPFEASTRSSRPIPPLPRRKPLATNHSAGPESAKTRIEKRLTQTEDVVIQMVDQISARKITQPDINWATVRRQQSAVPEVGKNHVIAALPATVRDSGKFGSLGESPRILPQYSGSGLFNAPPRYPFLARRRGQEGRVVLRAQVTANGDPETVRVRQSSGFRLLDAAAVAAVKAWRFVPASRGGIPVAGSVEVPISFKLTD